MNLQDAATIFGDLSVFGGTGGGESARLSTGGDLTVVGDRFDVAGGSGLGSGAEISVPAT